MTWGFCIICSRSLTHVAKHTADLCFGCTNLPVLKPEEGFFFPILVLETILKSLPNRHLPWPLCVFRDRLAAGCGLGWPHLQNPQTDCTFPKGKVRRLPVCGPVFAVCSCGEGSDRQRLVYGWYQRMCLSTTSPTEHYFPLFLLYITFAFSMLLIWAQSLLYLQSLHKSCRG